MEPAPVARRQEQPRTRTKEAQLMRLVVCAMRAGARATCAHRRACGALVSGDARALASVAARVVARRTGTEEEVVATCWRTLCQRALRKLRAHLQRGDTPAANPRLRLSALDWSVVDLLLLYDTPLLSVASFHHPAQLTALTRTCELVQRFQLEPAPGQELDPGRWNEAAGWYCQDGFQLSAVALQRRWHELKMDARLRAGSLAGPHAPLLPVHHTIATRYPHVVASVQMSSWRQLVAAGNVAAPTQERGPAPGELNSGNTAEVADATENILTIEILDDDDVIEVIQDKPKGTDSTEPITKPDNKSTNNHKKGPHIPSKSNDLSKETINLSKKTIDLSKETINLRKETINLRKETNDLSKETKGISKEMNGLSKEINVAKAPDKNIDLNSDIIDVDIPSPNVIEAPKVANGNIILNPNIIGVNIPSQGVIKSPKVVDRHIVLNPNMIDVAIPSTDVIKTLKVADRTIDLNSDIINVDCPTPDVIEAFQDLDVSNIETRISYETDEDTKDNIDLDIDKDVNLLVMQHSSTLDSQRSAMIIKLAKRNAVPKKISEDAKRLKDDIRKTYGAKHKSIINSISVTQKKSKSIPAAPKYKSANIDEENVNFVKLSASGVGSGNVKVLEFRADGGYRQTAIARSGGTECDGGVDDRKIDPKLLMYPVVPLQRVDEHWKTPQPPQEPSIKFENTIHRTSETSSKNYKSSLSRLCQPCSVVLDRVDRKGGLEGGAGRRVELPDMEEVRRHNRGLLTAQVAPLARRQLSLKDRIGKAKESNKNRPAPRAFSNKYMANWLRGPQIQNTARNKWLEISRTQPAKNQYKPNILQRRDKTETCPKRQMTTEIVKQNHLQIPIQTIVKQEMTENVTAMPDKIDNCPIRRSTPEIVKQYHSQIPIQTIVKQEMTENVTAMPDKIDNCPIRRSTPEIVKQNHSQIPIQTIVKQEMPEDISAMPDKTDNCSIRRSTQEIEKQNRLTIPTQTIIRRMVKRIEPKRKRQQRLPQESLVKSNLIQMRLQNERAQKRPNASQTQNLTLNYPRMQPNNIDPAYRPTQKSQKQSINSSRRNPRRIRNIVPVRSCCPETLNDTFYPQIVNVTCGLPSQNATSETQTCKEECAQANQPPQITIAPVLGFKPKSLVTSSGQPKNNPLLKAMLDGPLIFGNPLDSHPAKHALLKGMLDDPMTGNIRSKPPLVPTGTPVSQSSPKQSSRMSQPAPQTSQPTTIDAMTDNVNMRVKSIPPLIPIRKPKVSQSSLKRSSGMSQPAPQASQQTTVTGPQMAQSTSTQMLQQNPIEQVPIKLEVDEIPLQASHVIPPAPMEVLPQNPIERVPIKLEVDEIAMEASQMSAPTSMEVLQQNPIAQVPIKLEVDEIPLQVPQMSPSTPMKVLQSDPVAQPSLVSQSNLTNKEDNQMQLLQNTSVMELPQKLEPMSEVSESTPIQISETTSIQASQQPRVTQASPNPSQMSQPDPVVQSSLTSQSNMTQISQSTLLSMSEATLMAHPSQLRPPPPYQMIQPTSTVQGAQESQSNMTQVSQSTLLSMSEPTLMAHPSLLRPPPPYQMIQPTLTVQGAQILQSNLIQASELNPQVFQPAPPFVVPMQLTQTDYVVQPTNASQPMQALQVPNSSTMSQPTLMVHPSLSQLAPQVSQPTLIVQGSGVSQSFPMQASLNPLPMLQPAPMQDRFDLATIQTTYPPGVSQSQPTPTQEVSVSQPNPTMTQIVPDNMNLPQRANPVPHLSQPTQVIVSTVQSTQASVPQMTQALQSNQMYTQQMLQPAFDEVMQPTPIHELNTCGPAEKQTVPHAPALQTNHMQHVLQSTPEQVLQSTPEQVLQSTPQQVLQSTPEQALQSTPQQASQPTANAQDAIANIMDKEVALAQDSTVEDLNIAQAVPVDGLFTPIGYDVGSSTNDGSSLLDWQAPPIPSSVWARGRSPSALCALCLAPGAGRWAPARHLVLSARAPPPPSAAVWAPQPRRRLLLPGQYLDSTKSEESDTVKKPPWLKSPSLKTPGAPEAPSEVPVAPPNLLYKGLWYQKVCDDPLMYAMLLMAVESARSCQLLLERGATLQLYCLRTCRRHHIHVERTKTGFLLSGDAALEEPLKELTMQLRQLQPVATNQTKPSTSTKKS